MERSPAIGENRTLCGAFPGAGRLLFEKEFSFFGNPAAPRGSRVARFSSPGREILHPSRRPRPGDSPKEVGLQRRRIPENEAGPPLLPIESPSNSPFYSIFGEDPDKPRRRLFPPLSEQGEKSELRFQSNLR